MRSRTTDLISQSLFDEMRRAFRPPRVEPGFSRDKLLFEQGQYSVVEWLLTKLPQSQSYVGTAEITTVPAGEAALREQSK